MYREKYKIFIYRILEEYKMLTKVLWELHILYFFVCVNVYFFNFSNLFIVEIINFIM